MNTILFTNARDEQNILEWVVHHLNIGFTSICIFDHKSKIPVQNVLQNVPNVVVDRIEQDLVKVKLMYKAYQYAYQNGYDWMLYLDCDEFLVLNKDNNVADFINKYSEFDQVGINWLCFGSNHRNHILKDDETIIESYTKSDSKLNRHIKTFLNLKQAKNFYIDNPHVYFLMDYSKSINTEYQLLDTKTPFWIENDTPYNESVAYIAHYLYQSYDTYIQRKINFPRDDTLEYRELMTAEEIHKAHNDITNNSVLNKYNTRNTELIQKYRTIVPKIKIVYFAWLCPNIWEPIVREQLESLKALPLYDLANEIYMSVIADDIELEKLKLLLTQEYPKIQLINFFQENVYEYPGFKTLYEIADNSDNTYILYFHSKGMLSNMHNIRRILFENIISNYTTVLNAFENDKTIDVVCTIPGAKGFSYYNFFWVKSSYVYNYCSKPECTKEYTKHDRWTWEYWLGYEYSSKPFVKTYSPLIKYNCAYDTVFATEIMNSLEDCYIYNYTFEDAFYRRFMLCRQKHMNEYNWSNTSHKHTTHNFVIVYEDIFHHIRYNAKNVLEIGIDIGDSIELWLEYFPYAQVYGIDINNSEYITNTNLSKFKNKTLYTNQNAYDPDFIKREFIDKNIKFDIIIDDGPHTLIRQLNFIQLYLPLLSEKGILIIECIKSLEWISEIEKVVPSELYKYMQVYDNRKKSKSSDDIQFCINLSMKN